MGEIINSAFQLRNVRDAAKLPISGTRMKETKLITGARECTDHKESILYWILKQFKQTVLYRN